MRLFWPEQFCERFLFHLEQCRCRLRRLLAEHSRMSHWTPHSPPLLMAALRPDMKSQDLKIIMFALCHLFAPLDPGPHAPRGHGVTCECDVIPLTQVRHGRRHCRPAARLTHVGTCRGQSENIMQYCRCQQWSAVKCVCLLYFQLNFVVSNSTLSQSLGSIALCRSADCKVWSHLWWPRCAPRTGWRPPGWGCSCTRPRPPPPPRQSSALTRSQTRTPWTSSYIPEHRETLMDLQDQSVSGSHLI